MTDATMPVARVIVLAALLLLIVATIARRPIVIVLPDGKRCPLSDTPDPDSSGESRRGTKESKASG